MEIEDYIKRELDNVYVSTLIMKETAYKRENKIPIKQDVYIIMGLNLRGYKKIIDVVVPAEDTTSYWYNVISSYKSRGVEEFFMVALTDNMHMNKAFKMVYPNMLKMPSMMEFYNNSRPYILQKDHRKLMSKMQYIYKAENKEEAKEKYEKLKEEIKDNKLLLMIINKYIDDIMKVMKYSKEARAITSYTYTYLKMRSDLKRIINDYKVFESNEEIKKCVCEFLKAQEQSFKPSKKNWANIVNEMDSILTEKIREML